LAEESASVSENATASTKSHLDNAVVFAILLTLVVFSLAAVGRGLGNHFGAPGVTAFFGG
jgi:hypothetical protein